MVPAEIPVGPAWLPHDLTPASGRQDHTTSPSATTSFVRAPLDRSRVKPALRSLVRTMLPRPPHPIPTFVTMANAPLSGPDRGDMKVICVVCERKYFFEEGWTAN
jgi:hypothetical protein